MEAVGLVTEEALGAYSSDSVNISVFFKNPVVSSGRAVSISRCGFGSERASVTRVEYIRFLTMGMCFFAATILNRGEILVLLVSNGFDYARIINRPILVPWQLFSLCWLVERRRDQQEVRSSAKNQWKGECANSRWPTVGR